MGGWAELEVAINSKHELKNAYCLGLLITYQWLISVLEYVEHKSVASIDKRRLGN
jgi:hypothetical protein